jgi:hypothetical protein
MTTTTMRGLPVCRSAEQEGKNAATASKTYWGLPLMAMGPRLTMELGIYGKSAFILGAAVNVDENDTTGQAMLAEGGSRTRGPVAPVAQTPKQQSRRVPKGRGTEGLTST